MFVNKRDAGAVLSKSSTTLARYRKSFLIEGIHYAFVGNEWLYNKELLEDLVSCGMNPNHPDHQRAIAYYQSQKLGNKLKGHQKKKYQAT